MRSSHVTVATRCSNRPWASRAKPSTYVIAGTVTLPLHKIGVRGRNRTHISAFVALHSHSVELRELWRTGLDSNQRALGRDEICNLAASTTHPPVLVMLCVAPTNLRH